MERATLHWGVAVSVSRWTGGACAIVGGWARRRKRPAWPSTIAVLRADEAELRWAGIRRLSLFGSVARGDADAGGDIDLAVEFDPAAQMDLIRMVALERRVGATLGRSGDILPEPVEHRGLGR